MSPLQLTLPWWDDDPAESLAATLPSAPLSPNLPFRPHDSGMSSTPTSSLRSNHASDSVSPGGLAVFRHPAAEHEIRLGQSLVAFELKRCKRRSIGMVVSPEGLSVRAPRWATWSDIEQALQDKSRWICGKLVDQRDRGHKVAAARIDWCEGGTIPFMGEPVIMVLDPRISGCELHQEAQALPGVASQNLAHWAAAERITRSDPRNGDRLVAISCSFALRSAPGSLCVAPGGVGQAFEPVFSPDPLGQRQCGWLRETALAAHPFQSCHHRLRGGS